jgi:hypothetical protein
MRSPTIFGNFLRTLATPEPIKDWSLTSLKEKLIKIGEGGEPRTLCRLPNGGGRHPMTNVPGDTAADRGTTAAATTRASMKRGKARIFALVWESSGQSRLV